MKILALILLKLGHSLGSQNFKLIVKYNLINMSLKTIWVRIFDFVPAIKQLKFSHYPDYSNDPFLDNLLPPSLWNPKVSTSGEPCWN
jgi:hypothetical protein